MDFYGGNIETVSEWTGRCWCDARRDEWQLPHEGNEGLMEGLGGAPWT